MHASMLAARLPTSMPPQAPAMKHVAFSIWKAPDSGLLAKPCVGARVSARARSGPHTPGRLVRSGRRQAQGKRMQMPCWSGRLDGCWEDAQTEHRTEYFQSRDVSVTVHCLPPGLPKVVRQPCFVASMHRMTSQLPRETHTQRIHDRAAGQQNCPWRAPAMYVQGVTS